jgi:hypothetical protein
MGEKQQLCLGLQVIPLQWIISWWLQALLWNASRSSLFSMDIFRCIGVTSNGLQWVGHVPWHNLMFHLGFSFWKEVNLDFATQQGYFHILQRMFAYIPPLPSTKHKKVELFQLFIQLERLHLVGPHLQNLDLSDCKKRTHIHFKCSLVLSTSLFVVWPTIITHSREKFVSSCERFSLEIYIGYKWSIDHINCGQQWLTLMVTLWGLLC